MLCQNCSKREATTHIKRIVNGEATESHLCSECAHSLGYDGFFGGFDIGLPDFFSSFFGDSPFALSSAKTERCAKCGSSFDDIVRTGNVGCADCYEKFHDELLASIQRIHGRTGHVGKKPATVDFSPEAPKPKTKDEIIADKKKELERAVETQNFEQAAILRDEIKALEEDK